MRANLLRMGAVDFGIIVDGGVVIIESIVTSLVIRRPGEGRHARYDPRRAHRARRALEVVRPTVFSLLIIIAAYLPIFLLRAGRGSHLRADGEHRGRGAGRRAALLGDPGARCSRRWSIAGRSATATRRCCAGRSRVYEPTLRVGARATPWLVLGAAGALLAGAVVVLPHLGSEFLPELNEGSLYLTFTLPSNISPDRGTPAGAAHHEHLRAPSRRSTRCCRSSAGPRTAPTRR